MAGGASLQKAKEIPTCDELKSYHAEAYSGVGFDSNAIQAAIKDERCLDGKTMKKPVVAKNEGGVDHITYVDAKK